jgi:hypothetical protein
LVTIWIGHLDLYSKFLLVALNSYRLNTLFTKLSGILNGIDEF